MDNNPINMILSIYVCFLSRGVLMAIFITTLNFLSLNPKAMWDRTVRGSVSVWQPCAPLLPSRSELRPPRAPDRPPAVSLAPVHCPWAVMASHSTTISVYLFWKYLLLGLLFALIFFNLQKISAHFVHRDCNHIHPTDDQVNIFI